jgi:thioesterase domain-containing protein
LKCSGGAQLAEGGDLEGEALIRNLLNVAKAHREARRTYIPTASPAPITLFRARDVKFTEGASSHENAASWDSLGWSDVSAGPVGVVWVPGDHVTMMNERNAASVAESLRPLLSGAVRR